MKKMKSKTKKRWVIGIITLLILAVGVYFVFQHHYITIVSYDDGHHLFYKAKHYDKNDTVVVAIGDQTYVGTIAYQSGDKVASDKARFLLEGQKQVPADKVMIQVKHQGKTFYVLVPVQELMGKAVFEN